MEKIDIINSALSDVGNFVLVVFGFTITLFTVLYSFILNKRELLNEISDRLKSGEQDPLLYQRSSSSKRIIDRLKRLNSHLIVIIAITFITYFLCMLSKYFIDDLCFKIVLIKIVGIITFFIISYVSIMLFLTIKDYIKNTKI